MFQPTHFGHVEYTDSAHVNKVNIPRVRTGIEKMPYWPVYGIKMLARMVDEEAESYFLTFPHFFKKVRLKNY